MELSIRDVGMVYPPNKTALDRISLEISGPCMLGLVGPNGAGKTTLMKLLVTALTPTAGEILLDGAPLAEREQALKRALGYLPQSFGLYDELSVRQFLDYMAALKGIKHAREAIEKAIEETHLAEKRNARIKTLSGGQRQRVGIAQALLGNPALLVLDEPTVGLDPEERIQFRNLFSQAARERIVLLSTHIIEDVQSICNRLIVLSNGSIRFDGAPEALIRAAQGHVGVLEAGDAAADGHAEYHITARVNTARGVSCRVVAENLPPFARQAEPTLEDAYMYLLECGGSA